MSVPLTIVKEFVFLHADIDGTQGKIMFDTGTPETLVLNDHFLTRLSNGKFAGHAQVDSGQSYTETIRDCVHSVRIPGFTSGNIPWIESNDLGFIEKDITSYFMGFIGYGAYSGYAFELDYNRRELNLERNARGSRPALLDEKKILATLPFTTRRRANDPLISVKFRFSGAHRGPSTRDRAAF